LPSGSPLSGSFVLSFLPRATWARLVQLRYITRIFLLLSPLILVCVRCVQCQEQLELHLVATDLARTIPKSSRPSSATETSVLVVDFKESRGPASQLGHALAGEFSDSLQQVGSGLVILTRDKLEQEIAKNNLPEGLVSDPSATKCYASKLGADILVTGTFELASAGVVLTVDAWRTEPRKHIFRQEDIVIAMTDSMMELAGKPAPPFQPITIHEAKVWVSRDHPPLDDERVVHFPAGADAGYKSPTCISCHPPRYSDEATIFQVQGTVHLKVQTSPDGFVSRISLIDGLPCGLIEQAFEAVEHWTFNPAKSPDGTPVAAEVPAEMTFSLY